MLREHERSALLSQPAEGIVATVLD